jgi:hypothetical protein
LPSVRSTVHQGGARQAGHGFATIRGWHFPSAQAILLDAFVDGYGGGGQVFDWSLVPPALGKPLILSGGLEASNVGEAVRRLRPAAVDVSSGVEASKGVKDAEKMRAFVAAVRAAESIGSVGCGSFLTTTGGSCAETLGVGREPAGATTWPNGHT